MQKTLRKRQWVPCSQHEATPFAGRRLRITRDGYSKSLPRTLRGRLCETDPPDYGVDDGDEDVLIVVFVSVLFVVAGDGFTIVVLLSFFSVDGGFTVSVFCSQPASNAAVPTRTQMYFFIRL